jgi:recombinational DNA repair protein RecR
MDSQEVVVARSSWFDDKAGHPVFQEQVEKLESFTSALADGQVSKQELDTQEQRLVAAMKALEPTLNDAQHAQATSVFVELTAYNIMRLLHELQAERTRIAFGRP